MKSKTSFVAIDFETANQNRISACAVGLAFVKDLEISHSSHHFIKPPEGQYFLHINTKIHGIRFKDVQNSPTFDTLWENFLAKALNGQLVVFHNSSMDLSVLKNLFKHYQIQNFNFDYLDTMQIAKRLGYPSKISELSAYLDIVQENKHNPEWDAKTCAAIMTEFTQVFPEYQSLIRNLSYQDLLEESWSPKRSKEKDIHIRNENIDYVIQYSIEKSELDTLEISGKGFNFTGEGETDRDICKDFILKNGGFIKSSITSKVDYVVIGDSYGPSKIQKVHLFNTEKNCNIRILTSSDFEKLRNR